MVLYQKKIVSFSFIDDMQCCALIQIHPTLPRSKSLVATKFLAMPGWTIMAMKVIVTSTTVTTSCLSPSSSLRLRRPLPTLVLKPNQRRGTGEVLHYLFKFQLNGLRRLSGNDSNEPVVRGTADNKALGSQTTMRPRGTGNHHVLVKDTAFQT